MKKLLAFCFFVAFVGLIGCKNNLKQTDIEPIIRNPHKYYGTYPFFYIKNSAVAYVTGDRQGAILIPYMLGDSTAFKETADPMLIMPIIWRGQSDVEEIVVGDNIELEVCLKTDSTKDVPKHFFLYMGGLKRIGRINIEADEKFKKAIEELQAKVINNDAGLNLPAQLLFNPAFRNNPANPLRTISPFYTPQRRK